MYRIIAIGGREFCAGFALAGIETLRMTDASGRETLTRALARDDIAVVILDEQFGDWVDEIRPPAMLTQLPIVIPVPGDMRWRDVEKPGEDHYVAALIRQAVGYPLEINL